MKQAVVAGAGGFIGHHLVGYLKDEGYRVRGVDVLPPFYEETRADEFLLLDLRDVRNAYAVLGADEVYQLAADMGGIGYITENHAEVATNNVRINANLLEASSAASVGRYFYASSACVYPMGRQRDADATPLREEDVYPPNPERGYGTEKLFSEELAQYYSAEGRLETRIARFHNIYGPLGTYEGGREKAPAAICRKVAAAQDGDRIEVWGDGRQTRSFTYVDDCVEGIYRLMQSDYDLPLNLGTDRLVSIDELVDIIAAIAGKHIRKDHDQGKPQGVRGRNSDNTRLREVLGWEPTTSLEDGLAMTYGWIEETIEAVAHA